MGGFERAFVFFFLQSAKADRENFAYSFKFIFKLGPCRQNNKLLFNCTCVLGPMSRIVFPTYK